MCLITNWDLEFQCNIKWEHTAEQLKAEPFIRITKCGTLRFKTSFKTCFPLAFY